MSGYRALAAHLRPHRRAGLAGALLGLVGGALSLAQPLAAKQMVDDLGAGRGATAPVVALSALVVGAAVSAAAGQYVLERAAESVVCSTRRRTTARLLRLTVPELERREPGDLIARATSDTTLLRQVATQSAASAVTGVLMLVLTLVLMGLLDVVLLAVTLAVIAVLGAVVGAAAPRIGRAARQAQASVGEIGAALERVLGAVRTVKAAGAEEREAAVLDRLAQDARRTGVRAAGWQALSATASAVAGQVSFLAVLGVGGARVASGAIGVSTLVAFLLYLFALAPRISQLVEAAGQFQIGAAAAVRIEEIQRMEREAADPPATGPSLREPYGRPGDAADRTGPGEGPAAGEQPGRGAAAVRFERVGFRYRPGLPAVHHGLSFTVPAGGLTALVGPSGAGKTTVLSLLERFHEPDSGRVLLDGRDLRRWPLAGLRAAIGYVEQDAPVLSGTLRQNLTLGAPDARDDDLLDVLRRTRLEPVVARLPQGLDTLVGHRGSRLSGGERQRVAIARALLRRPRLLLLDEATSQLDAANEAALRETVAEAARTTTVLVVAHRLSTVTAADRIVVMEAGRVRAVGTHAELLDSDPLYRDLAATQLPAARRGCAGCRPAGPAPAPDGPYGPPPDRDPPRNITR
ncbi:ABC transporter ATP-binding protein [Streptomyces sp. B1866]|uniref:ABC transporter ATP-binding protein n=1 Tax=Streptomyces sp. B1866 TaxID=3075431 RepID=UPI0028915C57|nr:ABC transporter ATP-binding protein [Streptomyces sp. B1866]MDT3399503.1 ABC transporter ATP-binding protein [Streptomyces sp. B1866]